MMLVGKSHTLHMLCHDEMQGNKKQKTSTFLNGWNVGVLRRVDTRIFLQKVPTTHNQKSFSIWHKRNDLVFIALQWSIEKTQQVIWDAL